MLLLWFSFSSFSLSSRGALGPKRHRRVLLSLVSVSFTRRVARLRGIIWLLLLLLLWWWWWFSFSSFSLSSREALGPKRHRLLSLVSVSFPRRVARFPVVSFLPLRVSRLSVSPRDLAGVCVLSAVSTAETFPVFFALSHHHRTSTRRFLGALSFATRRRVAR